MLSIKKSGGAGLTHLKLGWGVGCHMLAVLESGGRSSLQ